MGNDSPPMPQLQASSSPILNSNMVHCFPCILGTIEGLFQVCIGELDIFVLDLA